MMMKKFLLGLFVLFSFTLTLSAQDISITDTDGKSYKVFASNSELKIEGMEGKVVFLEFFGLNCSACKQIMPNLINIQEKYGDKVTVMAIEVQQHEVDPINAYKRQHSINYPTFSNFDVGYLVRFIADKSGWSGNIPFLVAIDSTGKVAFTQAGIISEETLKGYMEKLLK